MISYVHLIFNCALFGYAVYTVATQLLIMEHAYSKEPGSITVGGQKLQNEVQLPVGSCPPRGVPFRFHCLVAANEMNYRWRNVIPLRAREPSSTRV